MAPPAGVADQHIHSHFFSTFYLFYRFIRYFFFLISLYSNSCVCVQAREDIILLLRSDRAAPETLEAQYGSSVPTRVLQALQRDGGLLGCSSRGGGRRHRQQQQQDVYEKPMAEVKLHPAAVCSTVKPRRRRSQAEEPPGRPGGSAYMHLCT